MSEKIILHDTIPNEGDTLTIVNCGDHYEFHVHSCQPDPLVLTDEDIERLVAGEITFN